MPLAPSDCERNRDISTVTMGRRPHRKGRLGLSLAGETTDQLQENDCDPGKEHPSDDATCSNVLFFGRTAMSDQPFLGFGN